jgi:U2 small nuclear ribonucleoprotein B''
MSEEKIEIKEENVEIIKSEEKNDGYIAPNPTIYIQNINEKIKLPVLQKQLYALFSRYGVILEIIAMNGNKKRGQAFVVFKDITSSTTAMRQLNGFDFNGKPLKISYAKKTSDAHAKLDGSYVDQKKKRDEIKRQTEKKRKENPNQENEKKKKKKKTEVQELAEPNKILFIENIPENVGKGKDSKILDILFQNYPGFKEVRLVPNKPGIAFVEYNNELQSSTAMSSLQGFKMYDQHLKITFAKK